MDAKDYGSSGPDRSMFLTQLCRHDVCPSTQDLTSLKLHLFTAGFDLVVLNCVLKMLHSRVIIDWSNTTSALTQMQMTIDHTLVRALILSLAVFLVHLLKEDWTSLLGSFYVKFSCTVLWCLALLFPTKEVAGLDFCLGSLYLHMLPIPLWVSSMYSGFFPQS